MQSRRLIVVDENGYKTICEALLAARALPDAERVHAVVRHAVSPRFALFDTEMDEFCSTELYDSIPEAIAACDPAVADVAMVVEVNVATRPVEPDDVA